MQLWSFLVAVLVLAAPILGGICPDGKVKCPDNMTCCSLANHEYGCCTYPEAQCCHDHVHCCPHGMKCDERHQACLKNGFPALFFSQISVKPEVVEADLADFKQQQQQLVDSNHINNTDVEDSSKTCPDGHSCPSSFTCCKMFRGHYGCCPYTDAKCCMDGFHCCPHGSQCDPVTGGCQNEEGTWLGKAVSLIKSSETSKATLPEAADPGGKCPDGHPCLEKFTCCHVVDGGYGCCPYTDAICCTDKIHCCPKNTNCNTSSGTCDTARIFSVPAFSLATMKLADIPNIAKDLPVVESKVTELDPDDICPDKKSKCYPGDTCCLMKDGTYGCCPFDKATCCSDHESCCPSGYRCAAGGMCQRLTTLAALPFLSPITQQQKPVPLSVRESIAVEDESINCPDGSICPDRNTCCSISSSRYGCCPMPLATCCGDMKHCCPHGYWCADSGCERLEGSILNKTLILANTLTDDEYPKVMLTP